MLEGPALGLAVCAVPTAAMLVVSAILYNIEVDSTVEAAFQYFAGGLILAAVAAELFPLMLDDVPESATWIGVTVGFVLAFSLINGLEVVVDYISESISKSSDGGSSVADSVDKYSNPASSSNFLVDQSSRTSSNQSKRDIELAPSVTISSSVTTTLNYKTFSKVKDDEGEELEEQYEVMRGDDLWHESDLIQAEEAIAIPTHRQHIKEHLHEVTETIVRMEAKSTHLLEYQTMSIRESEALAEEIDEAIHGLQYKIDHCRRLLQGSEVETTNQVNAKSWVTDEKKLAMKKRLVALRCTALHLMEHIDEDSIDRRTLREMVGHINDMDHHINQFHKSVCLVTSKWRYRNMMMPEEGAKLPMGLIVPVTIDCFVDGFMIGISVSLSSRAGFILAAANSLEMSFLGMAYSARLVKCTGSSQFSRILCLILPPILMFLSAGLGALLAEVSKATPAVFVGFVAFGVTALISLVCCELVIEANSSQGGEPKWYITATFFLAVWLVLMIDRVIPS